MLNSYEINFQFKQLILTIQTKMMCIYNFFLYKNKIYIYIYIYIYNIMKN